MSANGLNGSNGHRKPKQLGPGKKDGRPTVRTKPAEEEILRRITEGESLHRICTGAEAVISYAVACDWLFNDKDFQGKYAQAKAVCAEKYADEIIDIADDGRNDTYVDENGNQRTDHDVVQRSRLRVDARKWVAAKLLPKKYGDTPNPINVNNTTNILALPESKLLQLQERHRELLEAV